MATVARVGQVSNFKPLAEHITYNNIVLTKSEVIYNLAVQCAVDLLDLPEVTHKAIIGKHLWCVVRCSASSTKVLLKNENEEELELTLSTPQSFKIVDTFLQALKNVSSAPPPTKEEPPPAPPPKPKSSDKGPASEDAKLVKQIEKLQKEIHSLRRQTAKNARIIENLSRENKALKEQTHTVSHHFVSTQYQQTGYYHDWEDIDPSISPAASFYAPIPADLSAGVREIEAAVPDQTPPPHAAAEKPDPTPSKSSHEPELLNPTLSPQRIRRLAHIAAGRIATQYVPTCRSRPRYLAKLPTSLSSRPNPRPFFATSLRNCLSTMRTLKPLRHLPRQLLQIIRRAPK